ncbi:efflux RND transporter periplasmic adaptor subunit [Pelagicoccus sp. SDUM812003]|uniref:efflux RND transporter periplasmic adaptor subunit n=1 Tax=Pelagicoccus sp. SDUM812003 TaxID=3041267 RepID=UPI00280D06DF|nr:efflux RND transporter periplasmic adaptor subunit [Pelagicoccus sp. SDUM812003]MDQ8204554.1 efflux RND transporter periplasmic adaptor subunit [Pelagicoccus sp. SDUM812003]
MKKRYWITAIVVIGVALFAVSKFKKGDTVTEVTVGKAQRGDITATVTATGKIYPEVEVKISSEVGGEIVELPVKDGQKVEKGDLLVRVNPDTLEAQVLQQEAALRATQANSEEARARMLQSELDLKRLKNLYDKGYATLEQIDEAETALEVAKASYRATQSRIEQQEMSLKEAKDSLAKATTFAPIAGTITVLSSELGDRVVGTGQFEGTEILRVADLSQMEVRVEVSETDITQVKIGDKASVEIEALNDRKFDGVVTEIANSANEEGNGGNSDQMTTFLVKVRLESPDSSIRPGMTATADIRTATVEDVVKVPLQSVTVRSRDVVAEQLGENGSGTNEAEEDREPAGENAREDGPRFGGAARGADRLERVVFLFQDGVAKLVRVETGLADNRSIEIKSGLEEGAEIITGGYRVLTRELEHDKPVKKAETKKEFSFQK